MKDPLKAASAAYNSTQGAGAQNCAPVRVTAAESCLDQLRVRNDHLLIMLERLQVVGNRAFGPLPPQAAEKAAEPESAGMLGELQTEIYRQVHIILAIETAITRIQDIV